MLSSRLFPRLFIFSALTLALSAPTLATKTGSPEEKAVLGRLQALMDGLARRDRAAMAAQLLPGGSVTLMRNGKPVQMGFDAFLERLSAPGTDTREERIVDPLIRIDGNIAIIWTRFVLLLDGKVAHCGTDIFNLVKVDGRWLIAAIGDTSRTDCTK
jgi:Putative lumazine-binding